MRRCARWLAVVVLVAAAASGFAAAPACACSCAAGVSDDESARRADLAFEGVVVDIDEPWLPTSTAEQVTVRFVVESVTKGEAGDRVELRTTLDEASCGYQFALGRRYRVYAAAGMTDLCAGNRDLGAAPDVPLEEGWTWRLVGAAVGAAAIVVVIVLLRRRRDGQF